MLGLTFEKLLLVGIVAAFLLGPERLPHYSQKLGQLVRRLRGYTAGAKDRMREEMGPEFDEVDWKKLDPRQYDPRRIIRDALLDEPAPASSVQRAATAATPSSAGGARPAGRPAFTPLGDGVTAPFDVEAT